MVRVGGLIICSHKRNEGVNAQYHGLHQFNIDTAEGCPILWNQGNRSNIEASLEVKTNTNIIEENSEWVHFSIIKLEDFSSSNSNKQLQELLLGTVTYFLNRPGH